MLKRLRWWIVSLTTLAALGGGTYFFAPDIVRWYVEDRFPYVDLTGSIEIFWGEVYFHDVHISRPGLDATLSLVKVNAEKHVWIEGGEVTLNLDKQKEGDGKTSEGEFEVEASELLVTVYRDDLWAQLEETNVNSNQVCFDRGSIKHKGLDINVWDGCVKRDKSFASADQIDLSIKLPFKIPRMDQEQTLVVLKPTVEMVDRVIKFQRASIGAFTLVGPATIKLPDDDKNDSLIYLDAPKAVIEHPWIAPHEAYFENINLTAPTSVFRGGDGEFRLGAGRATVRIDPHNFTIQGDEDCGNWLDFLPHPLPEALQQMDGKYGGRMNFEVRAKPIPHFSIKHSCTYECSAEPIKSLWSKDFTYMAYNAKNQLFKRKAGPNTAGWVSIADLPPHIPHAFVLLEDPGFYVHKGIIAQALENSLKANLAKGSFVKGGSTITMQLAKNLWLRRHKTVGRKAYEALLTVALENCLSKATILEWYMNVVEYGPDLYGIEAASKHYFLKPAQQLEPDEAFYLASLLPRPKKAIPPYGGGLARAQRLMKMLANSGFISEHIVPLKEGEVLNTEGWEVNN